MFVEQAFLPDNLRPDLVIIDKTTKNTTIIADVTVPYKADQVAFKKARAEKEG